MRRGKAADRWAEPARVRPQRACQVNAMHPKQHRPTADPQSLRPPRPAREQEQREKPARDEDKASKHQHPHPEKKPVPLQRIPNQGGATRQGSGLCHARGATGSVATRQASGLFHFLTVVGRPRKKSLLASRAVPTKVPRSFIQLSWPARLILPYTVKRSPIGFG